PEVSIIVKEINSFSVYVMGEVAHPGKLQLRSDITFLQALTLAGGFTKFADADNIILLRREGKPETRMRINYKDIVSGKNPDGNILLRRGDTIVVP
ncbi:MAG TPA: SLBB domain-containing protein, partial [Candidatus Manganitrophaceae bacterium]